MGKANKHKLFNKEAAKAYGGSLKHFIKTIPPKKKPGRPPKKSKGRGRPPRKSTPDVMNADRTVAAATVATVDNEVEEVEDNDGNDEAERPKKKKSRTNWGAPANRQRIEKAISDYLNKEGNAIDRNGVFIENRTIYAGLVGIPFNTLYRYIHPDEEKRQKLGNGERGRKKLIDGENCDFVAETLARQDRCNDGASRKEAIDIIMDIEPDLTRKQASRQLSRVILPVAHANGILKKSLQKVQCTTSDRIAISIPQQYRWHIAVDAEYDFLRENNRGLCAKTKKSFGELMEHFIVGLDEMCIMSDAHGTLRVIGSADKKKHEKLLQDCRQSITRIRI